MPGALAGVDAHLTPSRSLQLGGLEVLPFALKRRYPWGWPMHGGGQFLCTEQAVQGLGGYLLLQLCLRVSNSSEFPLASAFRSSSDAQEMRLVFSHGYRRIQVLIFCSSISALTFVPAGVFLFASPCLVLSDSSWWW